MDKWVKFDGVEKLCTLEVEVNFGVVSVNNGSGEVFSNTFIFWGERSTSEDRLEGIFL